jgi:pSer/pThr/pTyr-binding forkhead associated (FHA) protein
VTAPADLTARITRLDNVVPEQVSSSPADDTDAVLVDQWARLHALREVTEIGRDTTNQLSVLHTSVSRKHLRLAYDTDGDAWTVTDLGSRNGTSIEGTRLSPHIPHPLGDRQLLSVGDVGFILVLDRLTLPTGPVTESYKQTAQSVRTGAELRISTPTTEGAGMIGHGDETLSLGSTQFALLRILAERHLAERSNDDEIRGFVRSVELLANLPWNTSNPEDNHLKQQVRRLRKALEKLGLPEAIESRHGFGYRLRVEPIVG